MQRPELDPIYERFVGALPTAVAQEICRSVIAMCEALPRAHYTVLCEAMDAEDQHNREVWDRLLDTMYANIEQLFDHPLSKLGVTADGEEWHVVAVMSIGAWVINYRAEEPSGHQ